MYKFSSNNTSLKIYIVDVLTCVNKDAPMKGAHRSSVCNVMLY